MALKATSIPFCNASTARSTVDDGIEPHDNMSPIIAAAAGLLLGGGAGYFLFLRVLTGKADSIVREAELKGESIKGEENPPGQGEVHQLKEKQADQRKDLDRKLNERQERIKKTESNLQRSIDQNKNAERQLKKDQEKLTQRLGALDKKQRTWRPTTPRPSRPWRNSAA